MAIMFYHFEKKCIKIFILFLKKVKNSFLPDGELNPGLPRDRRGY